MDRARYDAIGTGYANTRREDPTVRAAVRDALGDARSVVNVGAGTGSYEPSDLDVVAVEPSAVMIDQRSPAAAPALQATASALPLRDGSVDAAMAVLTIHHWDADLEAGVNELFRVALGPVVIVTYDVDVSNEMWLARDHLPEAAALDRATFPSIDRLVELLGGEVEVTTILSTRDTPDWNFGSFWAHPERVLDAEARGGTSAFSRMDPGVVARVVTEVESALADGSWDRRNGHLRDLEAFDAGMRLLVARR